MGLDTCWVIVYMRCTRVKELTTLHQSIDSNGFDSCKSMQFVYMIPTFFTRGDLLGKPKTIKVILDIDSLGDLPYKFSRVHSEGCESPIK